MDVCPHHLLVTYLGERESFTVPIDATSYGIFPISNKAADDTAKCIATLTSTRKGLSLTAESPYCFSEEGSESTPAAPGKRTSQEYFFKNVEKPLFLALEGEGDYGGAHLYIRPSTLGFRTYHKWGFAHDVTLTIGSDPQSTFSYGDPHIAPLEATLTLHHTTFSLKTTKASGYLYLNGKRVVPDSTYSLKPTDTLRLLDLTISVFPRFIVCNESEALTKHLPKDAVLLSFQELAKKLPAASESHTQKPQKIFSPAPRLIKRVHPIALSVEAPPQKKEVDDTPLIVRMGPSAVMGLASCFMGASACVRILQGADVLTSAPSLAMCVSLLVGMLIWPPVSRRYERRRARESEKVRYSAYESYLAHIEWRLSKEKEAQAAILKEMRTSPSLCLERAFTQDRHLFERTLQDGDALVLRVGTGDLPLEADISWPKAGFTLVPDPLLEAALTLSEKPQVLKEVPIAFDMGAYSVLGIAGAQDIRDALIRSLITQMSTCIAPTEVVLAAFLDPSKKRLAKTLRALSLTHAPDNKTILVATRQTDAHDLDLFLAHTLGPRFARSDQRSVFVPHYVILADSVRLTSSLTILSRIASEHPKGVTLIYTAESLEGLPHFSELIVDLKKKDTSTNFQEKSSCDGDLSSNAHNRSRLFVAKNTAATTYNFLPDTYPSEENLKDLACALSHIHIQKRTEHFVLPSTLGFLKSMGATSLETLDIARRWQEADATKTLGAPIGVDVSGEPLILDAHEAADGPHGLVAGTTGSGKSELLVSWIASLCVNFPPEQVSFVLIDYKGGGLASAFTRKNLTLPHLAGTITNLDGSEIARSLTSLRSELTRRQRLLDKAKQTTGEATMDALSYMRHFIKGDVSVPMPHLFIVADEFAELKQQESDFMEGLISAARIGRSLGVHLVLATQKPTGVISEQIAANSRFRVCLRVADAADSKEMLRRADAATLEGPGRLYLLVGYEERYTLGQAAYAGTTYRAHTKGTDDTNIVELRSATGRTLDRFVVDEGESDAFSATELDVTLQEIVRVAEGRCARRLWLDPLEAHPTLTSLKERYPDVHSQDAPWELNPVIGEIDDPAHQEKRALTLPLTKIGNAMLYASAGSGETDLLLSILYGICEKSPQEAIAYVVDMGAGSLLAFRGAPELSDVLTHADIAKIENLFKVLRHEVESRRNLFAGRMANLSAYNANSKTPVPSILVIVNNLAGLLELVPSIEDALVALMREGAHYGIHFVLSATSPREVRFRIAASCSYTLALRLADEDDYATIFGSMRGISIPKGTGRGLVRDEDEIKTFQSAYVAPLDKNPLDTIEQIKKDAQKRWKDLSAKEVPLLPEILRSTDIEVAADKNRLTLGMSGDTLEPIFWDITHTRSVLIASKQLLFAEMTLCELCREAHEKGMEVVVVDPEVRLGKAPLWAKTLDYTKAAAYIAVRDNSIPCLVVVANFKLLAKAEEALTKESYAILTQAALGTKEGVVFIGVATSTEMTSLQETSLGSRYALKTELFWIGEGVSSQYGIPLAGGTPQLKNKYGEGGGFKVVKGKAEPVKFVCASDADMWE